MQQEDFEADARRNKLRGLLQQWKKKRFAFDKKNSILRVLESTATLLGELARSGGEGTIPRVLETADWFFAVKCDLGYCEALGYEVGDSEEEDDEKMAY